MTELTIEIAGVKVMRSFDYCHFEVTLSGSLNGVPEAERFKAVDEMRKQAARLADKAVEQYKVAKENAHLLEQDPSDLEHLRQRFGEILKKPESERTPKDKAIVKAIEDRAHRSRLRYDYDDDFEEPAYSDPYEIQDDNETLF